MPVRDKAVATLAGALDGPGPAFNNADFTVRLGGSTMTRDEYEERYAAAYIRMIDSIDWNRVLLEATARHLQLNHGDDGFDGYTVTGDGYIVMGVICPECLNEALLCEDTGGRLDWTSKPFASRDPHA